MNLKSLCRFNQLHMVYTKVVAVQEDSKRNLKQTSLFLYQVRYIIIFVTVPQLWSFSLVLHFSVSNNFYQSECQHFRSAFLKGSSSTTSQIGHPIFLSVV